MLKTENKEIANGIVDSNHKKAVIAVWVVFSQLVVTHFVFLGHFNASRVSDKESFAIGGFRGNTIQGNTRKYNFADAMVLMMMLFITRHASFIRDLAIRGEKTI